MKHSDCVYTTHTHTLKTVGRLDVSTSTTCLDQENITYGRATNRVVPRIVETSSRSCSYAVYRAREQIASSGGYIVEWSGVEWSYVNSSYWSGATTNMFHNRDSFKNFNRDSFKFHIRNISHIVICDSTKFPVALTPKNSKLLEVCFCDHTSPRVFTIKTSNICDYPYYYKTNSFKSFMLHCYKYLQQCGCLHTIMYDNVYLYIMPVTLYLVIHMGKLCNHLRHMYGQFPRKRKRQHRRLLRAGPQKPFCPIHTGKPSMAKPNASYIKSQLPAITGNGHLFEREKTKFLAAIRSHGHYIAANIAIGNIKEPKIMSSDIYNKTFNQDNNWTIIIEHFPSYAVILLQTFFYVLSDSISLCDLETTGSGDSKSPTSTSSHMQEFEKEIRK